MRILNLLITLRKCILSRNIVLTILRCDKFRNHSLRFVGYSGTVGTKVGDETNRTLALNLHTFIQLLRYAHGLLCGKIERLACFLLECRCCKRKRHLPGPAAMLKLIDNHTLTAKLLHNGINLFPAVKLVLVLCGILGMNCLLAVFGIKCRINGPVFRRNEICDLLFSVTYDS